MTHPRRKLAFWLLGGPVMVLLAGEFWVSLAEVMTWIARMN